MKTALDSCGNVVLVGDWLSSGSANHLAEMRVDRIESQFVILRDLRGETYFHSSLEDTDWVKSARQSHPGSEFAVVEPVSTYGWGEVSMSASG